MGLLYTKYKIFNFIDKIISLPLSNKKILPPIHIRIKPINACNHSCNYCAYRSDNLQLGKDMQVKSVIPFPKMQEIISDLVEMNVQAVTFSGGGEPFLYSHFVETLKLLNKGNIKFASLTNGSLLAGEAADLFAQNGKWLRISMDGWSDKSYSHYRGVADCEYSMILKNINEF